MSAVYFVFTAQHLWDLPLVTTLIPGTETLYEWTQNIKTVAPAIDRIFMNKYIYEKELTKKELTKSSEFRQLMGQMQELTNQKNVQARKNMFSKPVPIAEPPRERVDNPTPAPVAGPSREHLNNTAPPVQADMHEPAPAKQPTARIASPEHHVSEKPCTPAAAPVLAIPVSQPQVPTTSGSTCSNNPNLSNALYLHCTTILCTR